MRMVFSDGGYVGEHLMKGLVRNRFGVHFFVLFDTNEQCLDEIRIQGHSGTVVVADNFMCLENYVSLFRSTGVEVDHCGI